MLNVVVVISRHKAIADYLSSQGFMGALEAFKREANLSGDMDKTASGLLEKKWMSVVRLQKKVGILRLVFNIRVVPVKTSRLFNIQMNQAQMRIAHSNRVTFYDEQQSDCGVLDRTDIGSYSLLM